MKCSTFRCAIACFITFNVIFWLMGCGLVTMGIYLHVNKGPYMSALAPGFNYLSASTIILTAGLFSLIIGFVACCGVLADSKCMMMTYFLIVSICIILEVISGVLGFVYRYQIENLVSKELKYSIHTIYPADRHNDYNGLRGMWTDIQTSLKCCGVKSYKDWYNINAWPGKKFVPDSCCTYDHLNKGCGRNGDSRDWYKKPCLDEIVYWVSKHLYIIGLLSVTFLSVQLVGVSISLILYFHYKRKRRNRRR
ncbi:tetraspanin-9-like [Tubulanus polymorphus]|uniref:tetraspanin-9-like n=1 Tax=Tubulanus polymorphus TaxID=672921 RepID=UPI003DA25132